MAGPIRIAVLANASQARRELGSVAQETSSLGSKLGRFGKTAGLAMATGLAVAGAAAVKLGADSVKAASDAQQSLGATETVFGRFADTVVKTSDRAAQKYGLSANVYRENANLLGSLFKNQGVSMDQLGGKTEKMIGTAADLAATFGGTTTDAVGALGAAFKGEFDQLERYGVSIKQSDVNARLAAKGQDKLTGAALKAAQQQATSALIMEQAGQTQGAFARESNTLAGQQQRLAAQFDNIKAKIGTALLPILTTLLTYVNTTVLPGFTRFKEIFAQLAPIFAPVIAFVQRLFASFNGSTQAGTKMQELRATVQQVWAAIQDIFRSAASIVQALWQTFGGTIVRYARTAFSALIQIIRGALRVIQGIFNVVAGILRGDWSRVWTGIKQIVSGAWSVIQGVVRQGWNTIRAIFAAGAAVIRGAWSRLWDAIKSVVSAAWNGIKSAVSRGVDAMMSIVRAIPGQVVGALSGLGSRLYNAGAEAVSMLARGIRDKAGAAIDALEGVASKLASLVPGSPVKEGPLKSLNNGHAGGQMMKMLAKGIKDNASKPVREALKVAQKTRSALVTAARSFRSEVADQFRGELFGNGIEGLRIQLEADRNDARAMQAALAALRRKGISDALAKGLATSGDLNTAQQLAALNRGGINRYDRLLADQQKASAAVGAQASSMVLGDELRGIEREIEGLRRDVRKSNKDLPRAVANGSRDGAREGTRQGMTDRNQRTASRARVGRRS